MQRLNRKGAVWDTILEWGFAIIVIAVLVIVIAAFQASQDQCATGYIVNASNPTVCQLATNVSVTQSFETSYTILGRGLTFVDNATAQLGTAGTILGAVLLVGALGGLGYLGYRRFQQRD